MPPSTKSARPLSPANAEQNRLDESARGIKPWRRWGTYLSERQWGTVREDYSSDGDAWNYFSHDDARSRAYRWGEDGIAGFCDEKETLCLAIALWNGKDAILKERLFGLTNGQGNHGEDVKELYYYLDATPTCSYARMLYKYPQAAYPYQQLLDENHRRGLNDPEFELMDTGVFGNSRYFDVFVEYAKADVNDILMRVTVYNRGPEAASLVLLPHIWFRNTWSWGRDPIRPEITQDGSARLLATHHALGSYQIDLDPPDELLFTENETNARRLFNSGPEQGFFKDAFHEYVIRGAKDAVNAASKGTKAAGLYRLNVGPEGSATVRLRMRPANEAAAGAFSDFDPAFADRAREADEFYAQVHAGLDGEDARRVQRQALAGMLWNRQCYHYNIFDWLQGDPGQPGPPRQRLNGRNGDWQHLNGDEVLSMPDKWEYPWFAAWDLGFHCVALSLIDPEFAKRQLVLLGREWYMHPNGQLPAYEWNFGDVNPPVHAVAAWKIYRLEQLRTGKGDRKFLERIFHKLMINFSWWVNREDAQGRNIFQGGFLGLDNIGVFDRSSLPAGGIVDQSDGTAWMAMYALNLMRIALELAREDYIYEDVASKFFEHFLYIARAMSDIAGQDIGLWDEEDNFYYSVLSLPSGQNIPLRVRSMVGLIPLFAVEVIEQELMDAMPHFQARLEWFLEKRPDLASLVSRWREPGSKSRRLLSLARAFRMKSILARMLDESEFLSPYGIRALSRCYLEHPYVINLHGSRYEVDYDPAESRSRVYGGNSNWRGPIWMPANYLIVESLRRFYDYYGDDFKVECPTGSGKYLTLWEVAEEIASRLMKLCLRDEQGRRAALGDDAMQQSDPNFRDYLQYFEYFHGDTGRGLGANHQTGWTGLIANLIAEHGQARAVNPNR